MKKLFIAVSFFILVPAFAAVSFAETLEQAWEIGLKVDHLIKAAGEETNSKQAQLAAAKGERLPTINLGAGYLWLDNEPGAYFYDREFSTADKHSLSYQAMVSLPLYTHFQISSAIAAATADLKAGEFTETTAQQNVKLKIAEAYIAILLRKLQTDVALSHEQSLAAHTTDVQNLHDVGMVPVNDLLAAQVALANAKQMLLQSQNRLDIARSAYNRQLNRPLDYAVDISPIPIHYPTADLTYLSQTAVAKRPELMALAEQVKAMKLQAKSAKAVSGPKVMLKSGYDYHENSHQANESIWQAMVMASWDIFDGNIARNKGRALQSQARALAERQQELTTIIQLQVRQSWLDMQESRKRIKVTKETLNQAEENLKVTRDRYKEGVGTNTEVLDAETLRTISFVNYDKAGNDAVLAVIRLRYATGEL
ncbi:MAG TPA: TolC family protein [Desulfarculaceae bacterium]|nr:TolC family protein [Desulfarculaceae bacterium]